VGHTANLTGWSEDRSLKTAQGTAFSGGHRRGDVVIIHSIPTTSVGIHVNGCRATLLALVTLNLLGDECWEALLHDGNLALPSEGGGRIVLPLHQMTAKSLFLDMRWWRLARAMMASPPTSTPNSGAPKPAVSPKAALSAPEAATSNVNLQASSPLCQSPNVSDPTMAQAMGVYRPTQPSQWGGVTVVDSLITGCRRYDRWRLAGV